MLRFMRKVLGHRDEKQQLQEALRRRIGICPICRGDLDGHFYWDIGSATVGSNAERKLGELIASRQWVDAAHYQQANALEDIRVWEAIQCLTGRISIFPMLLAIEVCADDKADAPMLLSDAESAELGHFVAGRWRPL